jgi:diacylglycerol kinase family enzyme
VAPAAAIVIWNASAGGANAPDIRERAADLLRGAGLEPHVVTVRKGDDTAAVVRPAAVRGAIVIAAGGDGTVNRVAAELLDSPAALGILPLGTMNHLAKDLRIPLDLEQAVATIAAGRTRRIDVGRVNDRIFLNNSSIGVYPSIVHAREELRRRGYRKWPAMALAAIRVLRRYRGVKVHIDVDGRRLVRRTPFVFVGNNEYTLDGIHLGERARLDGGRLFAYVAPRVHTRELPMLLVKGLLGRARRSGAFETLASTELAVDPVRARHARVAFDGEVVMMPTPLRYGIVPEALAVLAP